MENSTILKEERWGKEIKKGYILRDGTKKVKRKEKEGNLSFITPFLFPFIILSFD
jgi:hypothetical protein